MVHYVRETLGKECVRVCVCRRVMCSRRGGEAHHSWWMFVLQTPASITSQLNCAKTKQALVLLASAVLQAKQALILLASAFPGSLESTQPCVHQSINGCTRTWSATGENKGETLITALDVCGDRRV